MRLEYRTLTMTETTTIEIRTDQRDWLNEHKGKSYKSLLDELIESYENAMTDKESISESRVRELAREEINDNVVLEALE